MKGIVFTEFLEMVAKTHGDDLVDDLIDEAKLPHGGAYTSVGTYPHAEMVALVSALSRRTGLSLDQLLEVFGQHLFGRFYVHFPHFMDSTPNALQFLMGVESIVHTEVRKLYPDAQLPSFVTHRISDREIELKYHSVHNFSSLALGLIKGCALHYREQLEVVISRSAQANHGTHVDLRVIRRG